MSKLERDIAALMTMSPAQLRAEWRRVHRASPPKFSPDLLARSVAWRTQERIHGGLAPSTLRALSRLADRLARNNTIDVEPEISLKPGTRLVREWNGRTCHVLVGENGFVFEDRHYQSLSQIARAITGTNWSGPRFFGLKKRGRSISNDVPSLGDNSDGV